MKTHTSFAALAGALALAACGSGSYSSRGAEVEQSPPPDPSSYPAPTGALAAIYGAKSHEDDKDEGLVLEDLRTGDGPSAQIGDRVKVTYEGRLEDGSIFDSSRDRQTALEIQLGKGTAIKGFEHGIVGMKVGGIRKITIPYALGYGLEGRPPKIPPKSTLVFQVELLDLPLEQAPQPQQEDKAKPKDPNQNQQRMPGGRRGMGGAY